MTLKWLFTSWCISQLVKWVYCSSWHQLFLFYFDSHCTAQVSPVCAIVGGIVGQEVVKVLKLQAFVLFFTKSCSSNFSYHWNYFTFFLTCYKIFYVLFAGCLWKRCPTKQFLFLWWLRGTWKCGMLPLMSVQKHGNTNSAFTVQICKQAHL